MSGKEVRPGARGLIVAAALVVAALIVVVVFDVTRRANRMRLPTGSASTLQPRPDSLVETLVRLESACAGGRCRAEVLESIDESTYRATANRLDVEVTPQTRFIMGSSADVRAAAVLQVAGTMAGGGVLRAERIVILTGYLKAATGS